MVMKEFLQGGTLKIRVFMYDERFSFIIDDDFILELFWAQRHTAFNRICSRKSKESKIEEKSEPIVAFVKVQSLISVV